MNLLSVNVAKKEYVTIHVDPVETGIFKRATSEPVQIRFTGLEHDVIADTTVHGGKDQAVYLYSMEDYAWWAGELGKELTPGQFGENLTISSFGESPLRIGDQVVINDVVLEITSARVPCAKLAARMQDPGFVKQFRNARRPGAYARVLKEGRVQAGNSVRFVRTNNEFPKVVDVFDLWFEKKKDPNTLRTWMDAPLAERARQAFEYWLSESEEA